MKSIAVHVNDTLKEETRRKKVVEIWKKVTGWPSKFNLVLPYRIFVKEGELFDEKNRLRNIYLFSDIIIICNKNR